MSINIIKSIEIIKDEILTHSIIEHILIIHAKSIN